MERDAAEALKGSFAPMTALRDKTVDKTVARPSLSTSFIGYVRSRLRLAPSSDRGKSCRQKTLPAEERHSSSCLSLKAS